MPALAKRPLAQPVRPLEGAQLLLVEDSVTYGAYLAELFTNLGARTQHVFDGIQAQEALSNPLLSAVDLIVTDLQLPGCSGEQLARWVRSHPTLGQTPIVALTASEGMDPATYASQHGFDAVLLKTDWQMDYGAALRQHLRH